MKKFPIFFLLITLTGCSSSTPPAMNLTVHAATYLNPNIYDQPAPVVIMIYQLKSATQFQQADFNSLYNNPSATLGNDLLDKSEYEIRPNQEQRLTSSAANNTNYVGIVAAFRQPDQAQWRQVLPVSPGKRIDLIINLSAQTISAQNDKSLF